MIINLESLNKNFSDKSEITPNILVEKGLIKKSWRENSIGENFEEKEKLRRSL